MPDHDPAANAESTPQPSRIWRSIPFRGGGFAPVPSPVLSWLSLAVFLGAWQGVATAGWVSATFLPGPMAVGSALLEIAESGQLWADLSASLLRIGAGWAIGTALGLLAGVAMGLFSVSRSVALPAISALSPIPKVALLPLLILWFGIGEFSKIVTIAAGVFFPTAISTYTSIDSVPRNLIRMSQSFGVPALAIVRKTLLPGALPGILGGMRISIAIALLLVVTAEMIGAQNGLGAFILLQGAILRSDMLLAGVVVISVLGLLLGYLLSVVERIAFRWR
jgi:ABC-type nitrate/sulfonate/bicarbonate transport system permease component